jgi:hypothetical protein
MNPIKCLYELKLTGGKTWSQGPDSTRSVVSQVTTMWQCISLFTYVPIQLIYYTHNKGDMSVDEGVDLFRGSCVDL